MRVTDRMFFEGAARRTQAASGRMGRAVQEASTGRRLNHVWDDAGSAGVVTQNKVREKQWQAIHESAARASEELQAVDGALGGINGMLTRAREIAVMLANDTYTAEERSIAADEVQGLVDHVISLSNVDQGGRYLLGGTVDDRPPFGTDGVYVGNDQVRTVEIAPGMRTASSIRADRALNGADGGQNVVDAMRALETALNADDRDAIRTSIDAIDAGIDQVSRARAQSGTQMLILDNAVRAAELARDHEVGAAANRTDVDVYEATSRLALAQRALDAALTASSRGMTLTLLNKLR